MANEETHEDCNCGHHMDDAQLLCVQAENTIRLAIEWLQKDRLTLAAIFLSAAAKLIATSGETDGNASCLLHQARAGLAQKSGHKTANGICSPGRNRRSQRPGDCLPLSADGGG